MGKRRCGTCRFFQEAGLAGSGWCHHPQRKTTSDLMIMVRRNELACRDEWSHDLWTPVSVGDSDTADNHSLDPYQARPVVPATQREIAAVTRVQPLHE